MATILLVEDAPDLGLHEARLLEAAGHRLLYCCGGPDPLTACPMLRFGACPLPANADLIVFSCGMVAMRGRTYRGVHLLRAYREHALYGRLPMLVVSMGVPDDLPGSGPIDVVEKWSGPKQIVQAVERLLSRARVAVAPS